MQTIELTDEDAKTFLLFREYQEFFETLINADVHTLKSSNTTLYFNDKGALHKIIVEKVAFKK